jgi:mannose-6-phosphate isomerase-like protein (cupin superfamily)
MRREFGRARFTFNLETRKALSRAPDHQREDPTDSPNLETTDMRFCFTRTRNSTLLPTVFAFALALGWAAREIAHARDRAPGVESQTVNLDQVKMSDYKYEGTPVGHAGVYVQGETPGCANLLTGRFILEPGKSPHPPHVHPDEEILIVETGQGAIICDGKTTKVGPGSVMYSAPNVSHGITNTGQEPLTLIFVKWTARKGG